MKSLLSIALVALSLVAVTSANAGEKQSSRIKYAVSLLSKISEGGSNYKVKPGSVKEMMKSLALSEGSVESVKEFEDAWVGDSSDAWGADNMNWGTDTSSGASSYVLNSLAERLDSGENTDADKIKFADDPKLARQAFAILRSIKQVAYGVAPMGAVQCGVTFSSLMILDTETGEIYQVIMEGSGC